MSSKSVDYSSIIVNFNTIVQKLNAVAIDFAEKKNPNIKVENLAFSGGSDVKDNKFIGGGEYRLMGGMKDPDAEVLPKKDFCDVFIEYTSWFCGKEDASYVKEQMLSPIYKSEDENQDGDAPKEELSGSISSDGDRDVEDSGRVEESFHTKQENTLLDMLFEDDQKKSTAKDGDDQKDKKNPEGDTGDEKDEGNKETGLQNQGDDESKSEQKLIGYSVGYAISVNGKKDHTTKDWIRETARGLFGATLADLRNITITLNGKNFLHVGRILDPDKWKDRLGWIDIDKNRVVSNVKNALDHEFENNDADVRCMSGKALETYLNRKGKLTPTIQTKIKSAKYSVVISVNQKDPNYLEYDQENIAKTVSKGFGTTDRLIDHNKVVEKDVIKIDNIESLYKRHSSYDKELKLDVRDRASDGKTPSVPSTSSTARSTQGEKVPTRSTVTEKETEKKTDEKNKSVGKVEDSVKEDTELEKLVKSDEYKSFVSKELEEQCKLELQGDENTCKYGSTDEITDDMMQKGVNDLELLRKIKGKGVQSYYVTVTKNLKQTVNEAISMEKNLLKVLFEDVNEAEDILEDGDDAKREEALEAAADCINVTGDKERDKRAKVRIKAGVRNILKVDKVETQVKNRCERVIKNTIIKVLDQFETDRTFEDLDIDFFMTSVEKEGLEESIQDAVRRYFSRLSESITFESDKEDEIPQEVDDMNAILVGRLNGGLKKGSKGLHVDPYCAVSSSSRVAEYLKKHNLCDESTRKEILKKPYCGIVIAKRGFEQDGVKINGGLGEQILKDSTVNELLDDVCGEKNKIPVINCTNQARDVMDQVSEDLIAKKLSFYSERESKSENYKRNPEDRHVPVLDVWLRPFELEESIMRRPHPIPDPTSIVQWFVVLPDPIPVKKDDKRSGDGEKDPENHENSDKQTDWYIIPHRKIKDLGDRPHQETHYADGVTATKTSDDEYKP